MQEVNTQIWRSLLQLAQATYAVLEREVPESEGLPSNGLVVLRLLRWHGEKTLSAIAAFVGVTSTTMDETMHEMVRLGFVSVKSGSSGKTSDVFELSPQGVEAARRIIAAQKARIERSIARLSDSQHEVAAKLLETIAYELVAESTGFGITCAECWAFDAQECIRKDLGNQCAFLAAQRSELDPDLSKGPDVCPSSCSKRASQYVRLGTGFEERE